MCNRISFNFRHCKTHYVALYEGQQYPKKLATVCGTKKVDLIYKGPNLFLEFNSGNHVRPFDYNGFAASIIFTDNVPSTKLPATKLQTPSAINYGRPSEFGKLFCILYIKIR